MDAQWRIIGEGTLNWVLTLIVAASAITLLIGLWMLISPGSFLRVNRLFSRWYATERLTETVNRPRRVERFIYRRHRPVGAAAVALSLYTLYALWRAAAEGRMEAALARLGGERAGTWLLEGAVAALVLLNVFAFVIGVFLIVRPSLLKGFEAWANQWFSMERALGALDAPRPGVDAAVGRRPRLAALVIIVASLYVLLTGTFHLA